MILEAIRPGRARAATPAPGRHAIWLTAFAALGLLAAACAPSRPAGDWVSVHELTPAFLAHQPAADAAIAADPHGRVALTYVTRDTSGGRDLWLAISNDSGATFGTPVRLNPREGAVSSYAESRPAAVYGPGGRLAVAWSEKREGEDQGADLMVRASVDGGVTLGPAVVVNDDASDRRRSFHGFPALTFLTDGSLFAAWEDEREHAGEKEEPTLASLFYAVSPNGGLRWSDNRSLTDELCPCCRAVALSDPAGRVVVTWRGARDDLRDPVLAVSRDGGMTFGAESTLSADRWQLEACPSVGHALTLGEDGGGHFAWFTGAEPAGVYLAPWHLGRGLTGLRRPLADSLLHPSHPRLAALGSSTLIAVEARPRDDSTRAVVAVRALDPDGSLTPWSFLGGDARAAWLATLDPRSALVCWTEGRAAEQRVRVVRLMRAGARR